LRRCDATGEAKYRYDLGKIQINAVYIPRIPDYNEFAVFGFYVSIPLPGGTR